MEYNEALNIVERYFTTADAVKMQDARKLMEAMLLPIFEDGDTRPGTPFGDLILSPAAAVKASVVEALSRMLSDMSFSNLENGLVYNEEFALAYLKNFGDYERTSLGSYGEVRLQFPEDIEYTIPGHTRFRFNSPTASNEFYMALSFGGGLTIRPTGYTPPETPTANEAYLFLDTDGLYSVHLPIYGISDTEVPEGMAAFTAPQLTAVTGMFAAGDFQAGTPPASVQEYAHLVRRTVFDASLAGRRSAESYAFYKLPDLLAASATLAGDDEMTRGGPNLMGLQGPSLDLHLGSAKTVRKTLMVSLVRDTDTETLFGKLPMGGESLTRLVSVRQRTATGFIDASVSWNSLAASPVRASSPGFSGGLQGRESLYLLVQGDDISGSGEFELAGSVASNIEVVVETDPAVEVIKKIAYSEAEGPVGVSLGVRPFSRVVIDRMLVRYRKAPNMSLALEEARTELVRAMLTFCRYKRYSASVVERVIQASGADSVVSVSYDTHLEPWPVRYCLPVGVSGDPLEAGGPTYSELMTGATMVPYSAYSDVSDPTPELPWNVGVLSPLGVMGHKNTGFCLEASAIEFEEVL